MSSLITTFIIYLIFRIVRRLFMRRGKTLPLILLIVTSFLLLVSVGLTLSAGRARAIREIQKLDKSFQTEVRADYGESIDMLAKAIKETDYLTKTTLCVYENYED